MARCKPCMSFALKEDIRKFDPALSKQLEKVPDCTGDDVLNICECSGRTGKREGPKREPSAYNLYIGDCMRSKHIKGFGNAAPAMKECAGEWRKTHPKK